MKSSLVYAEIHGLDLALSSLKCVPLDSRSSEWNVISQWVENRLKTLRAL